MQKSEMDGRLAKLVSVEHLGFIHRSRISNHFKVINHLLSMPNGEKQNTPNGRWGELEWKGSHQSIPQPRFCTGCSLKFLISWFRLFSFEVIDLAGNWAYGGQNRAFGP